MQHWKKANLFRQRLSGSGIRLADIAGAQYQLVQCRTVPARHWGRWPPGYDSFFASVLDLDNQAR